MDFHKETHSCRNKKKEKKTHTNEAKAKETRRRQECVREREEHFQLILDNLT